MQSATQTRNAAQSLLGRTLKTGWKVIEKIGKAEYSTGSFFSVCYTVEKNNEICFLKAFDFDRFFTISGGSRSVMSVLAEMTAAFEYERDLSDLCKNSRVDKVAFVKDAGEEIVEGFQIGVVPYLIFDLADGDVRKKMALTAGLDDAWRLKSLHSIAVGLKQLHSIKVTHQDLKPSNILLFSGESKIGDIGRSVCENLASPYDELTYSGDYSYAPPEIIYDFHNTNRAKRNFATDCYLLGSLITFYFTGVAMNHILAQYIPDNLMWYRGNGDFDRVKSFLLDAYTKALSDIESSISKKELARELKILVEHLCFPIPEKRGHPKNINLRNEQYSLDRFIARLDLLKRKAEANIFK